jgi:hypothetical protein
VSVRPATARRARRARRLAVVGLTTLIGASSAGAGLACGSAAPSGGVPVVQIAAQRCSRPQTIRGLGVVVGEDLVATAAHTVEGELRRLDVDGAPGVVVALDARSDVALVAAPTTLDPVRLRAGAAAAPSHAVVHGADGARDVEIVRTGELVVHDTSAGRRHRRQVHTFRPGAAPGTSGAPLTTEAGELLGVVILDRRGDDRADAATVDEVAGVLAADRGPGTRPSCDD